MAETTCFICANRSGQFFAEQVCGSCRRVVSQIVIGAPETEVAVMWRTTSSFPAARRKVLETYGGGRSAPKPEVLASLAHGLLEQGICDDAIIIAAFAIGLGETADLNRVGASALQVLLDPRAAQLDLVARLQPHLEA